VKVQQAARGGSRRGGDKPAPSKPALDDMGPGVESIPRGPRSKTGRPGQRGGWKPKGN
jgi:excinuclease ABC subunit B